MDTLQRVLDHLPKLGVGKCPHECDQVIEARIVPVPSQRLEAHDRFLGIVEEPSGEPVQKVEVGADTIWQAGRGPR